MSELNLMRQYTAMKQALKNSTAMDALHKTRLHRSLSWLKAAAQQLEDDNQDLAFINLWISFSACFYIDGESMAPFSEKNPFIDKLVALDSDNKIYECFWHEYSGSVKALIKNPYVFAEFWQAQRLLTGNQQLDADIHQGWQSQFDRSSVAALNCLSRKKVAPLFSIVLDRLYVLRNQVLQGGATYQSRVNREQVSDGVILLANIMPIIISIMLQGQDEHWGDIAYPVVND